MNVIWSKYVQGAGTLYYSRKLRFDDRFAPQYQLLFGLDSRRKLRILEIGCGPGALAGALHRWYPRAEIVAIDRDTDFIRFAKEHEAGITFLEGDATALPFEDGFFDVTISNTVSEHIEPSRFYGEQSRVLRQGGVCLVLSSRKGLHSTAEECTQSDFEARFWEKAECLDDTLSRYAVCRYPMSEAELPAAMERFGFQSVSTGYVAVDLTPDDPKFSSAEAHDMINANRIAALDSIESVLSTHPNQFTREEGDNMKRLTNDRFDARIRAYDAGNKQWDTSLSLLMTVRGVKA